MVKLLKILDKKLLIVISGYGLEVVSLWAG
ncbi:hypothetical protein ACVWYN_001928 [Pedobacter sp. UYP24]